MTNLDAFADWRADSTDYALDHIDRKAYTALDLPVTLDELSGLYATYLLENGIVDATGEPTGREPDEDELLEALLAGYTRSHACDEARELLIAALLDDYLALLQEYGDED